MSNYQVPEGYEEISEEEANLPIGEVIKKLSEYGYTDCTEEANKQNGPGYTARWVFSDPNGHGVHYCNIEDDVRELWFIVE
jgi:hypothetical protein